MHLCVTRPQWILMTAMRYMCCVIWSMWRWSKVTSAWLLRMAWRQFGTWTSATTMLPQADRWTSGEPYGTMFYYAWALLIHADGHTSLSDYRYASCRCPGSKCAPDISNHHVDSNVIIMSHESYYTHCIHGHYINCVRNRSGSRQPINFLFQFRWLSARL